MSAIAKHSQGSFIFYYEWTEEAVTKLVDLWLLGISCSQIGFVLGCTKNAVIGKARRLKLPARKRGPQ